MKYEKIERNYKEIIEFFNKIKWSITNVENDLILNKITPKQYLTYYDYHPDLKEKSKIVIKFFFKKIKFQQGQWCWFWDDNFHIGLLSKYKESSTNINKTNYTTMLDTKWKNCITIKKFRKKLKKYL